MLSLAAPPPKGVIELGYRWEHLARQIVFDITEWVDSFGPGTARLLHQRPGDAAPYPVGVTRTDADGNPDNDSGALVLWDVTNTDTAQAAHYGHAELRYYSGAEGEEAFLVKNIYKTVVENALGAASEPPEEAATWLEAFMSAANQLETDAASALQAVSQTRTYQEAARIDANAAAASAQEARRAAEAAALITAPAAAGISFGNAAPVTLSDGGEFVTVVSGNFIAAAGTDVSVRASVGLSVSTVATGSAMAWAALSDATVTARCLFDDMPTDTRAETFDSGERLMNTQFHFVPEADGTHTFALQMRIKGGAANIAQGAATLEVTGANYAPDI